jgi:iron(III) transport system ATP-binding protein
MIDIRLEDISKVYATPTGAVAAVDDISLTIEPGEFFFLLGPSGCGKTTLLRIIAGLVEPTAGRVCFGADDVTHLAVEDRRTAMVFQNYALWPHLTVGQNVEFGPKMRNVPASQRRQIVQDCLHRVEMDAFAKRKPNQLSGGQQQRVALARALAAQGRCLLLDEPLSNLDARLRLHMRGQLRQLVKSTGMTAVYVTHDQKEALSMADRVAVMNAGKIVQVGPPEEIYNRPATRFVADFLGEANFVEGTVAAAGAAARIQTPIGAITAHSPQALVAGQQVTLCIRPERARLSQQARAGTGQLQATVVSCTYLGELRQYLCRLTDGSTWRVLSLSNMAPPMAEGQPVTLEVLPEDVTVLTD